MDIVVNEGTDFLRGMFSPGKISTNEIKIAQQCFDVIELFFISVDVSGRITFLNNRARKVLGYTDNSLIGKNFVHELVREEDQERVRGSINSFFNNEIETGSDLFHLRGKNNEERVIDVKVTAISDDNNVLGIIVSGKDVTGYTRVNEDLMKDINLHRLLFKKIDDLNVYMFDKNLRFFLAEGVEMQNIGLYSDDFMEKQLSELSSRKIKNIWMPLFKNVLNGEEVNTNYKAFNNYYLIKAFPLKNADNEIYSGLALVRNITRQKVSEKLLKKSKEEAVKSGNAKIKFLARVSHEIRTPLNAIMGFTEQLFQTGMSIKQKKYVNIIEKSSENLLSLVNDILIMSKIEANQVNLENNPFKINSVVRYVYNSLNYKAKQKNLLLSYEIDERLDQILVGDSFRLQQILLNLINNGIKFTDKGSVRLICSLHNDTREELSIKFDVIDSGIGISGKFLKEIFKDYTQSLSHAGKRQEGIGLGLSICKNLIELQNGSLSVYSQPGAGSTFSFIIPYRKGKDTDTLVFESSAFDPDMLKNKQILLVDDDSVNLLLASAILKKFKCKFTLARNGKEAIEKLDANKYDLILLDIHMPDISGVEVAKYLRGTKKDRESKIIALTAAAFKEDIMEYLEAGIDDFLVKPFKEIYLYNKICEVLKLGKIPVPKPKSEIILKKEISTKPYNLSSLKQMADHDDDFINHAIGVFIKNSEEAVLNFRKLLEHGNWKQIGETAHKILPSYRHLEAESVIQDLVEIKTRTLINNDNTGVEQLVRDVIVKINNLLKSLNEDTTIQPG